MMKTYYRKDNVGLCKYCLNFHDGKQVHSDGSPFYGIQIFKNKRKLTQAIKALESQGYVKK